MAARLYANDTRVPVTQSRTDIERLLEKHKARQYGTAVDYEARTARVPFRLHDRIVRFVIGLPDPARLRGERLQQAERQRWRALLLVLKAKLESVENNIESFDHAFLSQIVMPNDRTVAEIVTPAIAEAYRTGKTRLLVGDTIDGEVTNGSA